MDQRPFSRRWALDSFWCFCIGFFGLAAYYSHTFGIPVKGTPVLLVQGGKLQRRNMLWEHISKHDLEEDMRLDAETEDLSKIQVARLERSGDISFIKTNGVKQQAT